MALNENVIKVHIAVFFEKSPDAFKLALALKETFSTMFPNDPQMIPLPPEAPADAPRCVFQNAEGSANLTFGLNRMDLDNSLKVGSPWRNHIEVIELAFIAICKACEIKIKRLGIVVQTLADDILIQNVNGKININNFSESDEKNIAWVVHEKVHDSLEFNVNTNIQINYKNPESNGILTFDVNTSVNSHLPQEETGLVKIIGLLLDRIEEKMKDVFN